MWSMDCNICCNTVLVCEFLLVVHVLHVLPRKKYSGCMRSGNLTGQTPGSKQPHNYNNGVESILLLVGQQEIKKLQHSQH